MGIICAADFGSVGSNHDVIYRECWVLHEFENSGGVAKRDGL